MKRFAIKFVVFLLLGAVVNVAVAWGCALWSGPACEISDLYLLRHRLSVRHFGFGIDVHGDVSQVGPVHPPRNFDGFWLHEGRTVLIGWPLRGLRCKPTPLRRDRRGIGLAWDEVLSGHSDAHAGLEVSAPWLQAKPFRRLPLLPVFPGFLINTLFYALILWLLWSAPFTTRRVIRKRRGQCARCGYDLRGAEHEACPECGGAAAKGGTCV